MGALWLVGSGHTPALFAPQASAAVVIDAVAPAAPVLAPPGPAGPPAPARRVRRARGHPLAAPVPVAIEAVGPAVPTLGEDVPTSEPDGAAEGMPEGDGGGGMVRGLHGRPRELIARVIGDGPGELPAATAPVVSLREATALRVRDYFPRLPAASWPEARPYIVQVAVCVSEAGSVSDAVLQSSASPSLDPVVLAAVRSWRYRPRLVAGEPRPFCHGVTIAYERAF